MAGKVVDLDTPMYDIVYATARYSRRCPACPFSVSTPGLKLTQFGEVSGLSINRDQTPPETSERLKAYISDHWIAVHVRTEVTVG